MSKLFEIISEYEAELRRKEAHKQEVQHEYVDMCLDMLCNATGKELWDELAPYFGPYEVKVDDYGGKVFCQPVSAGELGLAPFAFEVISGNYSHVPWLIQWPMDKIERTPLSEIARFLHGKMLEYQKDETARKAVRYQEMLKCLYEPNQYFTKEGLLEWEAELAEIVPQYRDGWQKLIDSVRARLGYL